MEGVNLGAIVVGRGDCEYVGAVGVDDGVGDGAVAHIATRPVVSASNSLTGVTAGTYRLRVEDNTGCFESERQITLTNPPSATVEKETENNICNDCEGYIH